MPTEPTRPATRLLHDSLGDVAVPVDAKYGPQTQRAVENFPISGDALEPVLLRALAALGASPAPARTLDDWERLFLATKVALLDAFHVLVRALLDDVI